MPYFALYGLYRRFCGEMDNYMPPIYSGTKISLTVIKFYTVGLIQMSKYSIVIRARFLLSKNDVLVTGDYESDYDFFKAAYLQAFQGIFKGFKSLSPH